MEGVSRIAALLLATLVAYPTAASGQSTPQPRRIGFIEAGSRQANQSFLDAFREGLRAFGWGTAGREIEIVERWAEARQERLPGLVAELIGPSRVEVLVTAAGPATLAAKEATKTLPIVSIGAPDLVASGVVESFSRPGANITGVISVTEGNIKGMELLHEMLPLATRVGVLSDPGDPASGSRWAALERTAKALGVSLVPAPITDEAAIETALSAMRGDCLFVVTSPLTVASRTRILALARQQRLPTFSSFRGFTEAGGVLSAGTNLRELFRQGARLVDRVLRGAKPSDIPVEESVLEVVLNLRAARELGIPVPPALVARADEVIE